MVDRVRISEAPDRFIASILARRGASAAAIGAAIGLEMPTGPTWRFRDGLTVSGTGPGTWLACAEDVRWGAELEGRLTGLAAVVEQTGAYRVFQIEGPGARTLLQRGAPIDLDGAAFPASSVASTMIGYVDVIIRCLAEGQSYEVGVYRSYAESFLRWTGSAIDALRGDTAAAAGSEGR